MFVPPMHIERPEFRCCWRRRTAGNLAQRRGDRQATGQTGRLLTIMLVIMTASALVIPSEGCAQNGGSADDGKVAAATASWPNWMGINHDGVSTDAGWSTRWPDSGLPEVWEREIGIGFSSVAIQDGRLFTMGHVDGVETVHCFDVDSGDTIWQHSYDSELIANLYQGGPGATPTVDGEFVHTLGKEGQLYCFSAQDGDVVWQKELQEDLGVPLPEWGFNSSPYILGKQLLLQGGRIVSYEKTTGKKIWQTPPATAGYGTVAAFSDDGDTLLAVLDCDALRVLRSDDGQELDSFPWKSPFATNSTTPIVHRGNLFVSTGYQVGCGLFDFEGRKLKLVYDNRDMRNHFNNCILYDGFLYGFDGNSNLGRVVHLKCMDLATGEVAWKHRGLGCGSLMIADGKLLILGDDGMLVVAEATPDSFQEIASSKILDGRCWTVPVLFNNRVYARNAQGNLVCVQLPTKK